MIDDQGILPTGGQSRRLSTKTEAKSCLRLPTGGRETLGE